MYDTYQQINSFQSTINVHEKSVFMMFRNTFTTGKLLDRYIYISIYTLMQCKVLTNS